MVKMAHARKWMKMGGVKIRTPLLLGILVASSFVILAGPSTPRVHAAQPIPSESYFGNTFNSTEASLGRVAITNTTQLIDTRFTARYGGDAVPRVSIGIDYFIASAKYDVVIGVQADAAGNPSGHFLGAFVWNVTSGMCSGCGGWVRPGFAPKSYALNHTITLVAGTVYHLVVKYFNGTFVNNGGCYGADCLVVQYIGGTNFQQESLDMHYDPSQALLACANIKSCRVVPGANAVYALDVNGSAWWQGQTESMMVDRPIGAAKGGHGLDSFQGERFWMAWDSVTVDQFQVSLSKIGVPTGSLNLLVWNFTAPSAAYMLRTSNPELMLNQSLIPNLKDMPPVIDKSYSFSLRSNLTLEYLRAYQISFAIYGNTTTINGANEAAVEFTNSNYNSNPLNWDGGDGSANSPCPQYPQGCAGFRYTGSTDNSASEEWGYEDLMFIMRIVSTAVLQPMSVQMSNSAPPAVASVNGCHASPPTLLSDGLPHLVSVDPFCVFSVSFNNSGSTRTGFSAGGSFSVASSSQASCFSGTCPAMSLNAFEQVENTFRATPTAPTKWDAELKIPVAGTQLGSEVDTGCAVLTSVGGGRADCQAWFDYGTAAAVANPVAVSSSERWFAPGQTTFRQRTGGNNYTVGYVDQFNVSFAVSPVGSGTVHPLNSSLWESYGQISINGTAADGFGFVTWATDGTGIALASKDNATTTATIHGAGTITAVFVALVTQPMALSIVEQGGGPATFSLSGCSVSPTSLVGNGTSLGFSAIPSCSILVTSPADSQALRYRFSSGGLPSSTISVRTCSERVCPAFSSTYYEEVGITFAYTIVGGGSPSYPSLNFTSLGANTTQTEASTPITVWIDFGTTWSLSDILPGSSQTERWVAASGMSGTALAPATVMTTYQHQYPIAVTSFPTSCGTTTPAGASWEPAGGVFTIEADASKGCTFNNWNATSGISIAQPTKLKSTVSAQGPGTITAWFSKALINLPQGTQFSIPPSSLTSFSLAVYGVLFAGVAIVITAIVLVMRRRRAAPPGEP